MTRASRRKFHIIYKTTCSITGHWYIGMHSTDNLDDGYLGSGQRLIRSVKKHGKENHIREVLEFCPDRATCALREEEIVNHEMLLQQECMNLMIGGAGKCDRPPTKEETAKRLSEKGIERWKVEGRRETQAEKIKQWHSDPTNSAIVGEQSKIAWARGAHEGHAEKCRRTAQESGSAAKRMRPCTIDGVTIYAGIRELIKVLGQGKNGSRSPSLRYI